MNEELKLELLDEKTAVTHFTEGFNFLGFTVKKTVAREKGPKGTEREVVVHYPSTESVQKAIHKISELTDRSTTIHSHGDQIEALNAFLRGWGEYFRHSSAKKALRYVGSFAHMQMWKWLVQKDELRHGWRETKAKYYRDNTWVAGGKKLFILQSMKIEFFFYRKIKNPYLGNWQRVEEPHPQDPFLIKWHGSREYGNEARGGGLGWSTARETALAKTEGKCAICKSNDMVEVHHIKAKGKGGGNVETNLIPLCRTCHRRSEKRNSPESHQLRGRILSSGEPDALKGASPVRGETL